MMSAVDNHHVNTPSYKLRKDNQTEFIVQEWVRQIPENENVCVYLVLSQPVPQIYKIADQIWSIIVTTMHLKSMPYKVCQKPETPAVFNLKEKSVDCMKIRKLIKKTIRQMQERVKHFQMSGALRKYCSGSSKPIYTTSG